MKATQPAGRANAVSPDSNLDGREDGSALVVEHLSKRFGGRIAFGDVSFAYTIFGIFLAAAALFAQPGIASAVFEGSHLLVQLLFTPLLAGWSIWVGIAISARSADVRVAQQLGVFASLPPLAIVALMSLNVITPSTGLALGLAGALLLVDGLGWRAVAAMFDRERLVTGGRT